MQIPYHVTEIFDDINDSYWLWSKLTMEIVEEPLVSQKNKNNSGDIILSIDSNTYVEPAVVASMTISMTIS